MNFLNKLFIILSFIVSGCISNNNKDTFVDYLKSKNIKLVHQYIVITERKCMSCNRMFYQLTKNFLDKDDVVFIISAEGGLLNTEIYENKKNVYWDYDNDIVKQMKLLSTSGVIFLDSSKTKIDTIIEINPYNIDSIVRRIDLPYDI